MPEDSYEQCKLFDAEFRMMQLIWANEPINSTKLVKLCEEHLGWKKSTTYTVLKKLQKRQVLKNEKATVTSIVKLDDVRRYEGEQLLERAFNNSLPHLLVSFLDGKKISDSEADELRRIIDESRR